MAPELAEPVSKHQIRSENMRWVGRRGVGRLNPRRETKIQGANREVLGPFRGGIRLWTAGCWLERQLHQLKASTIMNLGIDTWP